MRGCLEMSRERAPRREGGYELVSLGPTRSQSGHRGAHSLVTPWKARPMAVRKLIPPAAPTMGGARSDPAGKAQPDPRGHVCP